MQTPVLVLPAGSRHPWNDANPDRIPARASGSNLPHHPDGSDGNRCPQRPARLLTHRTAFGDAVALPTEVLLARLKEDPEAPWATYGGRDDGLTAMRLGALLKDFDIRSVRWRVDGVMLRGYLREAFDDAWQRYCSPPADTDSDDTPPPDALPLDLTGACQPG
ncbi:MAG TPA: DUF3631 domain-containing protein [Kineosporiaceae bacterium]|nr:DUF3631 domain-containing protein [Kineosporiaceae bacterium]